jgi:hypothetical protein
MDMKKSYFLLGLPVGLILLVMMACSNNDDDGSSVPKSIVGYWQLVDNYEGSQQMPLTDIIVVKFGEDGTLTSYTNGEQTNQMRYWLEPVEGRTDFYGYSCGESPDFYKQYTGGANLTIDGDILRICSYGCFSYRISFYRRISSLNDVDRDLSTNLYEENPTTLKGTWHLTQVGGGDMPNRSIIPGTVVLHFNADKTFKVTNETATFLPSGTYSYEVVETNEYAGVTETKINIEGQEPCTYHFFEGMLVLDYGMAYDGPGYFFRKLR